MAYLGNAPARSFISFERQVFTIVNSQTAYTLSHSVTNENDIRLVVNNVVQEPGSGKAYTATGTALTLSAALTNGTDEMYCVFLGRATATNAPGAGSVGTSQLASDSVTLAKMASGTDGNIISYDASGNPVAVATGSAGQILTSAGAGAPPTFAGAGTNAPSFLAYRSSTQGIPNSTDTTIVFNAEVYDTASAYNTSNGIFTVPSGQGGKYYVTYGTRLTNWNYSILSTYVDDGADGFLRFEDGDTDGDNNSISNSGIVSLSAGATINVKIFQTGGGTVQIRANQENTWFGAFKLIGV